MSSAPNNARSADRSHAQRSRAWTSLSARLALWYIAVTISACGAAAAVVAYRTRAFLDSEQARSAQSTLEQFRQALENGGTGALQSMFDCAPRPGLALRLTDERDVELFVVASDATSRSAAQEAAHGDALGASPQWRVASTQVSQRRHLSLAMYDERGEALWHELRTTSLLILLGGLAIAIGGTTLITRRTLRPVTDLAVATQKILESGDLGLRVQTRATTDELSRLGQLFNRMLGKNQALVRAMHESLDYVAHDLRTPLTRLRAGAELALQGEADGGKEREALVEVIEESDRVLSMLTTLTDVIEAEAGALRLDKRRENLGDIAREAVELYEFVSKDAGVSVVTHLSPDVTVLVDRRRMAQVCANVIDNAIKYTPGPGRVEVSVFVREQRAVFRVSDSGVGIAEEDQARVWQRLFRADPSRGQRGLGLGLALVKAVVEAHGGEVWLESALGVGSSFEVRLPRAAGAGA